MLKPVDLDELRKKAFFNVNEVALLLSVHRHTVVAWIERGELLACRMGDRTLRIEKKDFEAFVEICKCTGTKKES